MLAITRMTAEMSRELAYGDLEDTEKTMIGSKELLEACLNISREHSVPFLYPFQIPNWRDELRIQGARELSYLKPWRE